MNEGQRFGELRALLHSRGEEGLEELFEALDLHGDASPERAQREWLPYVREHLQGQRELEEDEERVRRCALRTLAQWKPASEALSAPVLAMASELEAGFLGDEEGFSRSRIDFQLRMIFEEHAPQGSMSHMKLPADVLAYLSVARGRMWAWDASDLYAFTIHHDEIILSNTRYFGEVFGPSEEEELTELDLFFRRELAGSHGGHLTYGVWMDFASYSENHNVMVCLDERSPYWGKVCDFHDAHPWLNGEKAGKVEAEDLGSFLEKLLRETSW